MSDSDEDNYPYDYDEPDDLKCKDQEQNTCAIVSVRIASELMYGKFDEKSKDRWKQIYSVIQKKYLFASGNKIVVDGKQQIIKSTTKIFTLKNGKKADFDELKRYRRGRLWVTGRRFKVGDPVRFEGESTAIESIDLNWKVIYENTMIRHQKVSTRVGMGIGDAIKEFNKHFSGRRMEYRMVPNILLSDSRSEMLVEHLVRTNGLAILGLGGDYYYEKDNEDENKIYINEMKKMYKPGGARPPHLRAHAICCVDFIPENRGKFKPGELDGEYVLHDSHTSISLPDKNNTKWINEDVKTCRRFLDSIYMDYPLSYGDPGIVSHIYLLYNNEQEAINLCNKLKL